MSTKRMLFEVSWEVCNMVGGIHTVIATKIPKMHELYGENYVVIGPDQSRSSSLAGIFEEEIWEPDLMKGFASLPVNVRMGRWMVPGEPRCLLLQFDKLFEIKDKILADYWSRFGLNSLFGGSDYFEPVMFSHAAGMVIERFFCHSLLPRGIDTIVHCHEWLGCGGVLYLKERAPEIGTVFTTHATTLGRTLSSKRWDYGSIIGKDTLSPEQLAQQNNVVAKHSIESISAKIADCFTTVSSTTAEECEVFFHKKPDLLLLNGLDDHTPDPKFMESDAIRKSRLRLLEIARFTTGYSYDPDNTTILLSSGRYEFQNKGLDLTLEALGKLNQLLTQGKQRPGGRVLSMLLFPAGHTGPRPEVMNAFKQGKPPATAEEGGPCFISSHGLRDEANDPVTLRLPSVGLKNTADAAVHVVFVPIYLNGSDPLIPETYYQLFPAADLSLFPSFYEPWGYTPQESVAARVPTITSDLAGFGVWAKQFGDWDTTGVHVVARKNASFEQSRDELCSRVLEFLHRNPENRRNLKDAVERTSRRSRWSEFGNAYQQAHEIALAEAWQRTHSATYDRFRAFSQCSLTPLVEATQTAAHMRRFTVLNRIPEAFEKVRDLIQENLWWSWNAEVAELFSELDSEMGQDLWSKCGKNPKTFFNMLNPQLLEDAAATKKYDERLDRIRNDFLQYMSTKKESKIAYFCMEYGLTHILKIYSGGLGILAGDHLKTASDMDIPLCALGLAYRYGYFKQRITSDGRQETIYETNDFLDLPVNPVNDANGERLKIKIPMPSGWLWFQAWRVAVGRVDLYLLDTDLSENAPENRGISDRLYGGDMSHRLRQEFVLAIGGYELLKTIGVSPKMYHMNEGHTAFLVLARIARLMNDEKLRFEEALEYVRHSTVFTTHTPVPAGHDQFPDDMVAPYLQIFADTLGKGIPREMGRGLDPSRESSFSMTALAARGSVHINAVSKIHGEVSRRMFHSMVPHYHQTEVPVIGITNGVHVGTWVSPEWQGVFANALGKDWRKHLSDKDYWKKFLEVESELVWKTHLQAKRKLVNRLKTHLREACTRRREHPADLATALANLGDETFIATFARRFAPYKRAHLLFRDPARLLRLLSSGTPMVFLFSGKAHPSDTLGQSLITKVIEYSRMPEFSGKIIFIENYEIDIAQALVSGSDLWINNPIRPLEASGTSGMKAAMNGCLNLSVPDGWWAEAYNGHNGWAIGDASVNESQEFQDSFDSSHIYALLEQEVLPKYSRRNAKGVPEQWTIMMKESIASILPEFNTERMLDEYRKYFYQTGIEQTSGLAAERYLQLRRLTTSRKRLAEHWGGISFSDISVKGLESEHIALNEPLDMKVRLVHPNLRPQDIQVQAVLANEDERNEISKLKTYAMKCVDDINEGRESLWEVTLQFKQCGPQSLGVRVIPRACHENHPVDLSLDMVKWL